MKNQLPASPAPTGAMNHARLPRRVRPGRILALLAPVAAFVALLAAEPPRTFTGVITDTMCGADHAHMGIKPDAKCVVECVRMNPKKWKYALYDGRKIYTLSDQRTPEQYAAQKVKVTGVLYEKTGIIQVEKIEPAR